MATELNPKNFPVLSYVLDRLPSFTSKSSSDVDRSSSASSSKSDPSSSSSHSIEIVTQMPHLAHPNVLASMTNAIAEVAQTRSVLRTLGPRPDRAKLAEIDASLSESFEEIALSPNDNDVAEKEQKRIEAVDQEKTWYNSILKLNELHESYEKLLKEAEERLVRIYESAEKNAAAVAEEEAAEVEVNEEVVCILQQASENPLDRVDLSGRKLKLLPEAFGKIQGLLVLNLYNNQLEAIPDSIAGLQNLLELDVSTNFLETLPDSIGLLSKLKILNVSCNKLTTLPDSICHCGSLVVLDASYNNLTYLPTNIGFELVKLEKLLIHLNKIRSLPTSIGEMRSLRYLDAHFNELNGLPNSFRMLTNLEYLNLSSNFSDLQDLSASFGDLISLQELDLSNNQIHSLPDAFGTLVNLTKLNLDQNPLVVPPEEVVKQGVDAVKMYMGKRWVSMLEEEEKMANLKDEMDHPNHLDSCIGSSLIFQIPLRTCSQGEIGCRSAGDNVLEREGYAVSAGFSLRLVALGRGGDALGSMDSFVNRLLQYLGAKEERSVLAPSHEDHRSAAQITDGSTSNVDITAPGAIVALTLMYLKTESEVIFSKLSIPQTHYDLECVRPDFILLRVIARNLIMWSRISPTCDWIQSQVPEVVKNGISHLRDDMDDMYEVDVEALVQAYVNIVAGACISLGLRFAGTRDGNACALLNNYALNLLNEIKPLSATPGNAFPRGISKYVDRGTLEMCLYLIIISLSVVMARSGDLQVFRLLRFLRSRNSADGHANYGTQMAVSLATGFLFLGGGMRTFSTNNGSLALLLITLYPRLPSGPNDNRCHLQAFRHLYVLATEARWLQTIDVESGLPVYAPLEVTLKETKLYSETRFCEITPCILPERAILKRICVCGPRYWPQQIELVPEEKNWWSFGDKSDPFNSGVIYVKRKVGACSYVDDPVGCQSLLSRAMHKVFGLRTLGESNMLANSHRELDSDSVDHLVSTFSSDPSLIAFAQLCCDKSWNNRSDSDFKEFCLQVVFDCISKDRPALLQVYLSLYTTIGSMADLLVKSDTNVCDSLSITSLKVALAYNEAVSSGRLASSGGFVQPIFLASLRKRCEEILNCSTELKINLMNYLIREAWPDDYNSKLQKDIIILPWYLKWFSVPSPSIIKAAVEKIKSKSKNSTSAIPLLRLLLPSTHINAISEIDRVFFSSNETTVL